MDISDLKLLHRSCANHMRMGEMPTVSDVHKATTLSKVRQGHINSDGTTGNMSRDSDKAIVLPNSLV